MASMNELRRASFLTLALFAAGCGSSTNVSVFSCSYALGTLDVCADYTDIDAAEMTVAQGSCTAQSGTAVVSCPAASSLGTCTLASDGVAFSLIFYSGGGATTAEAEQACTTEGGVWSGAATLTE